jgi:hypothetical protein
MFKFRGKSLNMNNTTKTFRKLIEKNTRKNNLNKKIFYNKTEEIFHSLNKVFFKAELKETDEDYMFKEIKNQIRLNQEMVDLYGKNAKNKIFPRSREPIKFDKKIILNPLSFEETKYVRYTPFRMGNRYDNDKKLNLPCILTNNLRTVYKRESPGKESVKSKQVNNENNNNDSNDNTIDRNIFNSIDTESSLMNNNKKYNITFNNENPNKNRIINYFSKTNDNMNVKNSSNNNSTFSIGNKSNNSFDRYKYVMTLDNLSENVENNQTRHRRYFNLNDYGCNSFRNKYNYISNNYFKY